MSYILDALRRADAERQQGQLPHLYAAPDTPAPPRTADRSLLMWAGAGVLLLALAALLLVWWSRTPAAPNPMAVVAPLAPPAAAAPVPPVPPVPSTLPIVVSGAPAVLAAPSATAATAATAAMATAAPTPQPATLPQASSPAPATAPAPAPAGSTPAAPLAKPVPLPQLAPHLRRELPRLVVGGSVWSSSAASRFVILDGQLLHEGDTVATGLVLESIQPRSAVLRWRELRLELAL